MMAAMASPLTRGRFQRRAGRGTPAAAQAAPNRGSADGPGDTFSCLANSKNDNGRAPNSPPHSWGGVRRSRTEGLGEIPTHIWHLGDSVRACQVLPITRVTHD